MIVDSSDVNGTSFVHFWDCHSSSSMMISTLHIISGTSYVRRAIFDDLHGLLISMLNPSFHSCMHCLTRLELTLLNRKTSRDPLQFDVIAKGAIE